MTSVRRKETYSFRHEPRAVRTKYKGTMDNLMFDKRVVRGNTYAARDIGTEGYDAAVEHGRSIRGKIRQSIAKKYLTQTAGSGDKIGGRSEKVENMEATTNMLEELPMPTIAFMSIDKDDTREVFAPVEFQPKPAGVDVETLTGEEELFEFDGSVEPILEVIIGKSLEQGKLEVVQEEQLRILKHNKKIWEQARNTTLNEAQRLQAELQRHQEEKDRRFQQGIKHQEEEKTAEREYEAKTVSKYYFNNMQQDIMKRLVDAGHFYDPIVHQTEGAFIPWLIGEVARGLTKEEQARNDADKIIKAACNGVVAEAMAKAEHAAWLVAEKERKLKEAEEDRQRLVEEELAMTKAEREAQIKVLQDDEARVAEMATLAVGEVEED